MEHDRRVIELESGLCQALANPKRLEILYALADEEMTAGQLARTVDLPMSNLSQHLSIMKRHGLVNARKVGLHMHYRVSSEHVMEICRAVRAVLTEQLSKQSGLLSQIAAGSMDR